MPSLCNHRIILQNSSNRFKSAQPIHEDKTMKIRMASLALGFATALVLTGCGSFQHKGEVSNITEVEEFVEPGTTTLAEIRTKLGTPLFIGQNHQGTTFAAYAFNSNLVKDPNANLASQLIKVKIPNKATPTVIKAVYFTINDEGVVTNIDYYGASYITKEKINSWNEAERPLTPEEIREKTAYTADDIYTKYFELVANQQGTTIDMLPDNVKMKEFPHCNITCQTRRGAHQIFGTFKVTDLGPKKLPTDKQTYFFDNNPILPEIPSKKR